MGIWGIRILNCVLVLGFSLSAVCAEERVESVLKTRSGILERILFSEDERQFGVRLTTPDHEVVWLEEPTQKFSNDTKTIREPLHSMIDEKLEAVYEISNTQTRLLGLAPRVFDKDCGAIAFVQTPTPLSDREVFTLSDLKCADQKSDAISRPTTETKFFNVLGKENQNWVTCKTMGELCEWMPMYPAETEAATQAATLTFLWRGRGELLLSGMEFAQPQVIAKSMAFKSNRSMYDAENRTLSYGTGLFPDGLDAFIVIHEWTHSFIDDLNHGLYGAEAQVLHEAISDYWPSQLYGSPCFAPFDAQEVTSRKCVRDLNQDLQYPKDMRGDPHADSLVLSSALWELQTLLPKGIILEMIGESVMRVSKNPSLADFWAKMLSSYGRMLSDRPLLANRFNEIHAMLKRRGFEP